MALLLDVRSDPQDEAHGWHHDHAKNLKQDIMVPRGEPATNILLNEYDARPISNDLSLFP